MTVLGNTPVVFLRLAELQAGEVDATISAERAGRSVNYTKVSGMLEVLSKEAVKGSNVQFWEKEGNAYNFHSPRWSGRTFVWNRRNCDISASKNNTYECTQKSSIRGFTYLTDSAKEKQMGLGRDWDLPPLGRGELYISKRVAEQIPAAAGSRIIMGISLRGFFGLIWPELVFGNDTIPDPLYLEMTVKEVFSNPSGKYPARYTTGIFAEYSELLPFIAENYLPDLSPARRQQIANFNLYDYAQAIALNLPPSYRMRFYVDSNYDAVQDRVTSFFSGLNYILGFTSVSTNLSVLRYFQRFSILNLFLGLVINVVIFILLFICVVLIYSLLVTNVETRTFEIGILRMFGMRRVEVIVLLLFQALSYIAFSYPLGLAVGQGISAYLFNTMNTLIGVSVDARLTSSAILVSGGMGVLIPILSSILPISSALGHNLHDSLDTRSSKVKAVEISMERSEDNAISWPLMIVGTLMIVFGVSIYYLLPYALLSFNLAILLNIFVCLLVGLLLGMTILSVNLNNTLEKILVFLLLFWERAAIRELVRKNLVAHRLRNRKTTILYAVSLAFIVFITVSYQLQLSTFLYAKEQENGCLIKVTGTSYDPGASESTAITQITDFEEYALANPNIEAFGWISMPLSSISENFTGTFIENIGHFKSSSLQIYAASPQLFDVTIPGFLQISKYDGEAPLLEEMYTVRGSHSMIIGATFEEMLQLGLGSQFLLRTSLRTEKDIGGGSNMWRRLSTLATLDAAPAFTFSKFPTVTQQDALVSFPTFVRLSNGTLRSVDDIPMKDFVLKLKSGLTNGEIDKIKNALDDLTAGSSGVKVWDYRDDVEPIEKATEILAYFFNFTTIVALIVCWFSLNSSMFANIYEQTKEISILRAMGLTKFWMYRIYVYEALILVLSSAILGVMIGVAIGYTMTIQRSLYTQLPIPFVFPTNILEVVGLTSLLFAVLASFGPIHFLLRLPIVSIMRIQ